MFILGHRGAHDPEIPGIRENTVEAFQQAAAGGADGVELDVRGTADGVLVVHHDPALADGRPIATIGLADLPSWLPTLDDALDACAGMALVDVEIKASPLEPSYDPQFGVASQLAAALAARPGPFLVSSFNLGALDAFHAAAPGVATGWLTMTGFDQARAAADAAERGHTALNPPENAVTSDLVSAVHDLGLQIVTWTVNDPVRMAALGGMGVDVMVTDVPVLARLTLR